MDGVVVYLVFEEEGEGVWVWDGVVGVGEDCYVIVVGRV